MIYNDLQIYSLIPTGHRRRHPVADMSGRWQLSPVRGCPRQVHRSPAVGRKKDSLEGSPETAVVRVPAAVAGAVKSPEPKKKLL